MQNIPQSTLSDAEMAKLKAGQQAIWSSGDYGVIGVMLQIVGDPRRGRGDLVDGAARSP